MPLETTEKAKAVSLEKKNVSQFLTRHCDSKVRIVVLDQIMKSRYEGSIPQSFRCYVICDNWY